MSRQFIARLLSFVTLIVHGAAASRRQRPMHARRRTTRCPGTEPALASAMRLQFKHERAARVRRVSISS